MELRGEGLMGRGKNLKGSFSFLCLDQRRHFKGFHGPTKGQLTRNPVSCSGRLDVSAMSLLALFISPLLLFLPHSMTFLFFTFSPLFPSFSEEWIVLGASLFQILSYVQHFNLDLDRIRNRANFYRSYCLESSTGC